MLGESQNAKEGAEKVIFALRGKLGFKKSDRALCVGYTVIILIPVIILKAE